MPEHRLEGLTEEDLTRMLRFINAACIVSAHKGTIRSIPQRK